MVGITKIGIIGFGTIGKTIAHVFKKQKYTVLINDIKYSNLNTKEEIAKESDYIFLCLPTPTDKNGCNIKILENVINDLDYYKAKGILIIKSTVIPGTTNKIIKKYPKLKIIYSPEFLTEKNALENFLNPDRIVFGGNKKYINRVIELFYNAKITPKNKENILIYDDPTIAEMGKYASNCFLATKVSYVNQIKIICKKYKINPSDVMKIVITDSRIGKTHLDPTKGPYEGKCLPKDIKAIIHEAKKHNIYIPLLEAIEKINEEMKNK